MFRTTFWGVRGSIPAPGAATAGVGGNTSCVEVRCGTTLILFDAGTGLRAAGRSLLKDMPITAHLFLSHVHWDHIQGFPFFAPAFIRGNTIHLYGGANVTGTVESAMGGQMEYPNFPVKFDQLPSKLVFHDLEPGERLTVEGKVVVRTQAGNHPGGVLGYRVEYEGKCLVYLTDNEHLAEPEPKLVELCRSADVLIYDCMYTPEEYEGADGGPEKRGWGHSTYVAGAELATSAHVHQLVLFHHDPEQSDTAVREKERRTQQLFAHSLAAYEGLTLDIGAAEKLP